MIPYPPAPLLCHPAAERTDSKRITLNGKRQTIHLCAYGWEKRYSWGHTAYCPELGLSATIRYYNRTWERHRFDSVIGKLLHECRMTDAAFRRKENAENRLYAKWRRALKENKIKWPLPAEWQFKAWSKRQKSRKSRRK